MKISLVKFGIIEGAGQLFDFNTTLPLIGLQFIVLTIILTFLFYLPIFEIIKKRLQKNAYRLSRALSNLATAYYLTDVQRKNTIVMNERYNKLKIGNEKINKQVRNSQINFVRKSHKFLVKTITINLRRELNIYLFKTS